MRQMGPYFVLFLNSEESADLCSDDFKGPVKVMDGAHF